jgi:heme/copper-type cytochrome/quinol oxidase subunit 1
VDTFSCFMPLQHLLKTIHSPRRCRQYVPMKCWNIMPLHGAEPKRRP